MNHRERILAAIHHQPLDRIPTDIWATPEVWEKLFTHFLIDAGQASAAQRASIAGNRVWPLEATLELYDRLDIDGILGIEQRINESDSRRIGKVKRWPGGTRPAGPSF